MNRYQMAPTRLQEWIAGWRTPVAEQQSVQSERRAALSVVIPTRNEEANIAACIESVLWASEIFVVDSASTDATLQIAQHYPVRAVQFQYRPGGPKKYNWSLEHLPFSNDWVLFLDADERISPQLRDEIREAITIDHYAGYYINLQYIFLGAWLRHTWNPVWRLRLFKHAAGRYERFAGTSAVGTGDNEVHERVILRGEAGFPRQYIVHHDYKPFAAWLEKHNRYSTWEAATALDILCEPLVLNPLRYFTAKPVERKRMVKRIFLRVPGRPLLVFLWLFVVRRGFLDGYRGLVFSLSIAYYWLCIGIKMREGELMSRARDADADAPCRGAGP